MKEPAARLLRVIGAGLDSAAARLEKLSRVKWAMQTVSVRQFSPVEFSASFGAERGEGFGSLFAAGEASFIVFFSAPSATAICRAFLGGSYKAAVERDAVAEISNIVANAMVDEIGDAKGEPILLSAPRVVEGPRSDVLARALESFRGKGKMDPIVSQVHMTAEGLSADCAVVLLMPGDAASSVKPTA